MSTFARIGILAVLVAGFSSLAVAAATNNKPPEMPKSYLFSGSGHLARLRAGVTYQASELPIAPRVRPPDGSWTGAQWKTGKFNKNRPDDPVGLPPFYGWAALGQGGTNPRVPPRALILIMTAYAPTPSVAATVSGLRTRGHGATYEATSSVKVAGFSGTEFDGKTAGAKKLFIPFTPPTHGAGGAGVPDAIEVDGAGQAFRFIVLNVRGKTVVVFMAADELSTFLTKANQILESLRFPKGG